MISKLNGSELRQKCVAYGTISTTGTNLEQQSSAALPIPMDSTSAHFDDYACAMQF